MLSQKCNTELSIVVPCLDEESMLPALFETLSLQLSINLEVIISDGGSQDSTCRAAVELATHHGIPVTLVTGEKGRGRQLDAGAAAGRGEYVLFLHADSRFADQHSLKKGIETLAGHSGENCAAKFQLRFDSNSSEKSLAYYFYESKAALLRPECTHGDQGLMMHRDTYKRLGPFENFPPMLAETRFADKIKLNGCLLGIPAEIFTSARRFEREGMYQRQVLNAILMNCASQRWDAPFLAVSGIYRNQSDERELQLFPILDKIRELITNLPEAERRRFWKSTGSYVRSNAWQLAFLLDVRRNFKRGFEPGNGPTSILDRFDRLIAPILDCRSCDLLAYLLTWSWFYLTLFTSRSDR